MFIQKKKILCVECGIECEFKRGTRINYLIHAILVVATLGLWLIPFGIMSYFKMSISGFPFICSICGTKKKNILEKILFTIAILFIFVVSSFLMYSFTLTEKEKSLVIQKAEKKEAKKKREEKKELELEAKAIEEKEALRMKKKKQQEQLREQMKREAIADKRKRDSYIESVMKEKKVMDATWYSETQLWASILNNGKNRDGFADYLCVLSKDFSIEDDFTIILFDAQKMQSNKGVRLGRKICVSPKNPQNRQ